MSATLDKMKRLIDLGLPVKLLMPVMEIIEGRVVAGITRKRRKRRTKEEMAKDAAKSSRKKRKKTKQPS